MIALHILLSAFRPMPDIDTLMQEWSPEFEELLGKVREGVGGNMALSRPSVPLFLCFHSDL